LTCSERKSVFVRPPIESYLVHVEWLTQTSGEGVVYIYASATVPRLHPHVVLVLHSSQVQKSGELSPPCGVRVSTMHDNSLFSSFASSHSSLHCSIISSLLWCTNSLSMIAPLAKKSFPWDWSQVQRWCTSLV